MEKVIGFHNPTEEYGFLSNWYLSNFTKNGIEFSSMEQYMMYGKAMCFHDETIAKQILQTDDVTRIKELGRLVSNYNDQIWSGMRQIIVYEGLVEKFSQNQELSDALLNTGDAFLAECAVKDKVWGIGLSMTDPKRLELSLWRGQNLLGFALMMVRNRYYIDQFKIIYNKYFKRIKIINDNSIQQKWYLYRRCTGIINETIYNYKKRR